MSQGEASERAAASLPAHTRRVIVPVLLAKLATLALIGYFAFSYPEHFHHDAYIAVYRGNHGQRPDAPPTADIVFRTWDAEHYLTLAERGYGGRGPENAFYPLYPLLVRAASKAMADDTLAAALLVSFVLGVVALLLLHDVLVRRASVPVANAALALLCVQPAAFYTCLPYSESLFLLLVALLFSALARERLVWAGLFGALLCLTRPVGILVAAPIALHALSHQHKVRALLTCLLPLLGWGAYFAIVAIDTGDPLIGFRIQKQFVAAPAALRLLDPVGFFKALIDVRTFHGFIGSALDRLAFLWFVVSAVTMLRGSRSLKERDFAAFAWALGMVPAVTTSLMSFTRYLSVLFPVHLETACWLARRRVLFGVVCVGLCALQVWLLSRHVTHGWAG